MPLEVWIAGLPSQRHGAGTELDNLIDLMRRHGVGVYLAPLDNVVDSALAASLEGRGCHVREFQPTVFADKVVVAFANAAFLAALPEIARCGRPACVAWFNCGLRPLRGELDAHAAGLIDLHGFVSRYQRDALVPLLEVVRPVRTFDYRPYLNVDRIEWRYRPWNGHYVVGRISRDDPRKFPRDNWRIFQRIEVPPGLVKQVHILGFELRAAAKTGPPPPDPALRLWRQGAITPSEFFHGIDTLVYKTGSAESYGRVIVEACAHGVVPVVERAYAFPELVIDGETGYLASDSAALSECASRLAADPALHFALARNARAHMQRLMDPERCWQPWRDEVLARG